MSFVKVLSGGVWGIEGYEVKVEVDVSSGLPSFTIVGLPDSAIKESKERVRSAIKNSGYSFPQKRITVNLSPSHLKKQGTLYDLPIAIGLLALGGVVNTDRLSKFVLMGELSLNGELRKVSGVLPIVATLYSEGYESFILPVENSTEGAVVEGAKVFGARSLREVVEFINGARELEPVRMAHHELSSKPAHDIDVSDIIGQGLAKKALEICAAGAHNLSMVGPPGSGKSMLAKRVVTILPPLSFEEALEVNRIYSVAGLLDSFVTSRPFRSPHHTASEVALIGGGSVPRPGEVSLAHKGVLFLDELPEFSRKALEVLRQPLEDGYINISRAQGRVRFPAEFTLITAQNPCPCGNYGNPYKECVCSPRQIKAYSSKVSQPIKDRIDLKVWMDPVDRDELVKNTKGETSQEVRNRVITAYSIQMERLGKLNGRMNNKEVEKFCINRMSTEAKRLLKSAVNNLKLSARAYFKVLKVSRTVADLEQEDTIRPHHVAQALQFRTEDKLE